MIQVGPGFRVPFRFVEPHPEVPKQIRQTTSGSDPGFSHGWRKDRRHQMVARVSIMPGAVVPEMP